MNLLILILFIIGYICIAAEHIIRINKAATALITAVVCWTLYVMLQPDNHAAYHQLHEQLAEAAGILFFLLGAMTIVELVDAHDGFRIITDKITATRKRSLFWIIGFLTFLLSAILDNLTTTIVIISLCRKIVKAPEDRIKFAGMTVIAANAGGAWSPIGDVTTTMLWIGGQITATNIILKLVVPSIVCMAIPLLMLSAGVSGNLQPVIPSTHPLTDKQKQESKAILLVAIIGLLLVPIFKSITGLPPYMGMLFSLGIIWGFTEIIHKNKPDKEVLSVSSALQKIDTPSILFFLGILLSIGVLQSTGLLSNIAAYINAHIPNLHARTSIIGMASALVDNVPLVAAVQGMYSLDQYPTNHILWEMLAFTTGTGGSLLIIGSAAGVVAMGMEKISFVGYIKKFSLPALIGYVAGVLVYIAQDYLIHLLQR